MDQRPSSGSGASTGGSDSRVNTDQRIARKVEGGGGHVDQLAAAGRAARVVWRALLSRWWLRKCTRVGYLTRVTDGLPLVSNEGTIRLGSRVRLTCSFAPVELRAGRNAVLEFGNNVSVNFGASFVARQRVTIGSNVSVGPYCIISDTESEAAQDLDGARPIVIGDGCWLASRVVVLPGCSIGAGTVVTAGSVVGGDIPANVVIGGSPVRILRTLEVGRDARSLELRTELDGAGLERPPVLGMPTDSKPSARQAAMQPGPPLSGTTLSGLLISDFTIDPLAAKLSRPGALPALIADIAPFGQVVPTLMNPPDSGRDVAVIWTLPESFSVSFQQVLAGQMATGEALRREVDDFIDLAVRGLAFFKTVLIATWTQPPWKRGLGLLDSKPGGTQWALSVLNGRLLERTAELSNFYVLNAETWVAMTGPSAYSQRLWFNAKVPFGDGVFEQACETIRSALGTIHDVPRKLLVLDLDNTLWGGVVGDVGWEGLTLGGHDGDGEAFVAFQRAVKALRNRGVLLGIVSKNEEETALLAIDSHDEMVLRRSDFVGWRINWNDKAANIAALAAELNLGLQSVVFIDDSEFERARVQEALPEVLVPEWPVDPSNFLQALNRLSCFDVSSITAEDLGRTAMYAAEQQRAQLLSSVGSLDEWLEQLSITIRVDDLSASNVARSAQLLNKTNQMNLSTRRLTEDEFRVWSQASNRRVLALSVSDRLGDAGLTGLLSVEANGVDARVVDFVLSCRVMGRRIEEAMLALAVDAARDLGARHVVATCLPTPKNKPCQSFFAGSTWAIIDDQSYEWNVGESLDPPAAIKFVSGNSSLPPRSDERVHQ